MVKKEFFNKLRKGDHIYVYDGGSKVVGIFDRITDNRCWGQRIILNDVVKMSSARFSLAEEHLISFYSLCNTPSSECGIISPTEYMEILSFAKKIKQMTEKGKVIFNNIRKNARK